MFNKIVVRIEGYFWVSSKRYKKWNLVNKKSTLSVKITSKDVTWPRADIAALELEENIGKGLLEINDTTKEQFFEKYCKEYTGSGREYKDLRKRRI